MHFIKCWRKISCGATICLSDVRGWNGISEGQLIYKAF